jgi:hypothetical protein
MKRFLLIACCLFVLFAGAASAWADCKQISFAPDWQNRSSVAKHMHGHHSDSNHTHSHDGVIHCPTLDEFLPAATFSPSKDHRAERVLDTLIAEFDSQYASHRFHRLINGPPNFYWFSSIPSYLLLSALRI